MKRHLLILAIAALASAGGAAHAQIVMDGTKDAAYGPALSIQTTNTQFGNATNGDPINGGGGSEIDAVYATVSGGRRLPARLWQAQPAPRPSRRSPGPARRAAARS